MPGISAQRFPSSLLRFPPGPAANLCWARDQADRLTDEASAGRKKRDTIMNTASRVLRKISLRRAGVAVAASGALAMTAALTLAGPASASPLHGGGYQFRTVDNAKDLTFNQLLGVDHGAEL